MVKYRMETVELPFLKYEDSMAYLEDLDNPKTKVVIHNEAMNWTHEMKKPVVEKEHSAWFFQIQKAVEELKEKPHEIHQCTKTSELQIWHLDHGLQALRIPTVDFYRPAVYSWSLAGNLLLIVEDVEYVGSEVMILIAYSIHDNHVEKLWSVSNVGSEMVTDKTHVYIQSCKTVQRYYAIKRVSLSSGEAVDFAHTNRWDQIVRPLSIRGGSLWYFQEGSRFRSLYTNGVKIQLDLLGFSYPLGWTDTDVYNVRTSSKIFSMKEKSFKIQSCHPLRIADDGFLIVTCTKQIIALHHVRDGKLRTIFAPQTGGIIKKIEQSSFLWFSPISLVPQTIHYSIEKDLQLGKQPRLIAGLIAEYTLLNRNGYNIPVTIVKQQGKTVAGLIAVVYAHYGVQTHTALTVRWLAWIRRGWIIAYIGARGGGDDGIEGWDSARGGKRAVGFLDFISATKQIQVHLDIPARKTILYGRSAGGFHVANAVVQLLKPQELFGAVWAEVPFVDVVKGCVNKKIPDMPLEKDEFFNCYDYFEFRQAVSMDPTLRTPAGKMKNGVSVLATGGVFDSEVGAWEPLKWCAHLRSAGQSPLCRLSTKTGHFMSVVTQEYIEMLAECSAFLSSSVN